MKTYYQSIQKLNNFYHTVLLADNSVDKTWARESLDGQCMMVAYIYGVTYDELLNDLETLD